jgi:hypothetical protein
MRTAAWVAAALAAECVLPTHRLLGKALHAAANTMHMQLLASNLQDMQPDQQQQQQQPQQLRPLGLRASQQQKPDQLLLLLELLLCAAEQHFSATTIEAAGPVHTVCTGECALGAQVALKAGVLSTTGTQGASSQLSAVQQLLSPWVDALCPVLLRLMSHIQKQLDAASAQ